MYVGTVVNKRDRDHDNAHLHRMAIDMVNLNCNHDNAITMFATIYLIFLKIYGSKCYFN